MLLLTLLVAVSVWLLLLILLVAISVYPQARMKEEERRRQTEEFKEKTAAILEQQQAEIMAKMQEMEEAEAVRRAAMEAANEERRKAAEEKAKVRLSLLSWWRASVERGIGGRTCTPRLTLCAGCLSHAHGSVERQSFSALFALALCSRVYVRLC